ncbi:hypothetical protein J6590_103422 [Homalodisca vitripennis]|nr:hypothetical protein J6590_103422 [Homalodisca vitripennis]
MEDVILGNFIILPFFKTELYTLRFLSANKSLFPLHLKHLLYSPPIRKQPASTYLFYPDLCPHPSGYPGFRLPLYVSYPRVLLIRFGRRLQVVGVVLYTLPLIIPVSFAFRRYNKPCPIFPRSVRPLRHLTLPCAADETSRYLIAFRAFPHKPYPLLNTPTCTPNSYLPYVLQRRFIQKEQRRHFKQVGTSRPYNPTERCCWHCIWEQTDYIGGSAHAPTWLLYKGAYHQHSSFFRSWETTPGRAAHSFLGDHPRWRSSFVPGSSPRIQRSVDHGRPPQEALRDRPRFATLKAIQAPLRLPPKRTSPPRNPRLSSPLDINGTFRPPANPTPQKRLFVFPR